MEDMEKLKKEHIKPLSEQEVAEQLYLLRLELIKLWKAIQEIREDQVALKYG